MSGMARTSGTVVMLDCGTERLAFYENTRHQALAREIAELKGFDFAGDYVPTSGRQRPLYFVPHETVIGTDMACALGIRTEEDLFGGVVPEWFMATKAIVHQLISPGARKPNGWDEQVGMAVLEHVLPGYTAFDLRDAHEAGIHLLQAGPVRVKNVFAAGGQGQIMARTTSELDAALRQLVPAASARCAVVIELNLEDVTTYSIGQCYLDGLTVSYWGTQRTTLDNSGGVAYGGSDLNVVRGDFQDVIAIAPTHEAKRALKAAQAFDSVVLEKYAGVFASRRNYDVAQGHDANGVFRCGVIDQSWRIGGTSGVEVAAARILKDRPELTFVKGSSFNVYGEDAIAPPGAIVHFQDVDHEYGPMLMYTIVESMR
jgi:hypothetical protein